MRTQATHHVWTARYDASIVGTIGQHVSWTYHVRGLGDVAWSELRHGLRDMDVPAFLSSDHEYFKRS